ncbi:MAG: ABC transporter substrate-binding protein [Anaerolineae bacterium]
MSSPGPTKSTWRTSSGTDDGAGGRGLWTWAAALGALLAALGLTLLPGTLGGVGAQGTKPAVVVGLVAPFEGLLRWEGYRLLHAVKLALWEANARGGVGGHAVVLVALDDGDDPARAARVARQMAADPSVVAVIGHFSTETTEAAFPVYAEFGIPVLAPVVPAADAPPREGLFFLAPGPLENGAQAIPSGDSLVRLDPTLDEVGVWAALAGREGERLPLYWLGPEVCHPTMARLLMAIPGTVGCGALAAVDEAQWPTFGEAYRAFSGALPTVRAGLAYDAAWAVLHALARSAGVAGGPVVLRSAVAKALGEVHFSGVTGEVRFDARGRRLGPPGGAWQLVPQVRPWEAGSLPLVAGP